MAKKKQIPKDKRNRDKQDSVLVSTPSESPKNTDNIQLIKFDRHQALFLALLVLFGVISYANTLHSPFYLDDQEAIQNNSFIRMKEISGQKYYRCRSGIW